MNRPPGQSGTNDLFRPVGSFLGVPQTHDLASAGARAAIVGLPFDAGTHPRRVGARLGPAAIRFMSTDMVRHHLPEADGASDPVTALNLVDVGDVDVVLGDTDASLSRMRAAIGALADAGAMPIALGGDGMVSVPTMEALGERHPGLAVIHFDSHTDAYPEPGGGNALSLNPATTFAHAATSGAIDPTASVHVGLRGLAYVPGVFAAARAHGYHLMPMSELEADGFGAAVERMREIVGTRPVFLCFDMDVFDPSAAPGVFTPAWGGLTAREAFAMLRGLAGLNFVGFDINTTTPTFDLHGQTAWLAATVALEMCRLALAARGSAG